jgi:hypothetical protein
VVAMVAAVTQAAVATVAVTSSANTTRLRLGNRRQLRRSSTVLVERLSRLPSVEPDSFLNLPIWFRPRPNEVEHLIRQCNLNNRRPGMRRHTLCCR